MHNVAKYTQTELQELSAKYTEAQKKLQEITNKLAESEEKMKDTLLSAEQEKRDLTKRLEDQSRIEKNLRARLRDSKLDSVNIYKQITALRNYAQTLQDMNLKLEVGEHLDSKSGENPIEAINTILNTMNSIHVDNIDVDSEINFYPSKNEQDNQINSPDVDLKQLKSPSSESSFTKDQLDDMQINVDDGLTEYILPPPSRSSSRRTLVNGNLTNLDNSDTNADSDTSSEATDDMCSMSENSSEESVVETKKEELDIAEEVSKRLSTSYMEMEGEIQWSQKMTAPYWVPEEQIAKDDNIPEISKEKVFKRLSTLSKKMRRSEEMSQAHCDPAEQIAKDDNIPKISTEEVNDTLDNTAVVDTTTIDKSDESERREEVTRVSAAPATECEERVVEGDYVNTLKPIIKNDTMQQALNSRDYVLQTFIGSLDSLQGEDSLEAQQIVKRELEELKNWLIREPNEVVINRLKELYYRAKNEVQRMQEVNEELVIVKEKYNAFVEEKAELSKKYMSLKAQCGDLLSATYTVPIHYVAPIAIMLVWMLLEKIF